MAPERVGEFAALGRRKGFDLFVMYGQTEATARMAVLPPDLAEVAPGAIGRPVPGGRLSLRPVPGADEGTGELVYEGANVMLGYAETPADLALGRTTARAARPATSAGCAPTGSGRSSAGVGRVAKVLGLRVDLDRVERAAGGARRRRLRGRRRRPARPRRRPTRPARVDAEAVRRLACDELGLPATAVDVVVRADLPAAAERQGRRARPGRSAALAATGTPAARPPASSGDARRRWRTLYGTRPRPSTPRPDDTFVVPRRRLAVVRRGVAASRGAARPPARRTGRPDDGRRARPARREAPARRGTPRRDQRGAAGRRDRQHRRLARQPLHAARRGAPPARRSPASTSRGSSSPTAARGERVRRLLRSAARIAVPSRAGHRDGRRCGPSGLDLAPGAPGQRRHQHRGVERAGLALLVRRGAGLDARRRCGRARRRARGRPAREGAPVLAPVRRSRSRRCSPATTSSAFRATTSTARTCCSGCSRSAGPRPARPRWQHRALLSVVAVVSTVPGFFDGGRPGRDAYVVAGLLVAGLGARRPRAGGRSPASAGVLAGASLWIYLLHWQVYPHLEHSHAVARDRALPGRRGRRLVARSAAHGAAWRRRSGIVRPAARL